MQLKEKVFKNIIAQMRIGARQQQLQQELRKLEIDLSQSVGAMDILSQLVQEETGVDLRTLLDTDPEWKKLMDDAQSVVQAAPAVPEKKTNLLENADGTPKSVKKEEFPEPDEDDLVPAPQPEEKTNLKKVTGNKMVSSVDPDARRAPVRVVIDDSPPQPGPDRDDD